MVDLNKISNTIYQIRGGGSLTGEVDISGAKNAALPILVASSVVEGNSFLENVPEILDINTMIGLLQSIGVSVHKHKDNYYEIENRFERNDFKSVNFNLASKIRPSLLFLGAQIGKLGRTIIPAPGGCSLGKRSFNMHIEGLEQLGAEIKVNDTEIVGQAKRLKGTEINLEFPTVTGTENIILASIFAEGKTKINNCAREPEVVDLIQYLKKCGAKISGEGTKSLEIEGNRELHGCRYTIIPDRMETGSFLAIAAAVRSKIIVKKCEPKHLESILVSLERMGAEIETMNKKITFSCCDLESIDLITETYPGFPTDLHPIFAATLCTANNDSSITETIYGENRFKYVKELRKMGARIKFEGNKLITKGNTNLIGSSLISPDLRGGMALIIAALVASGKTEIYNIFQIERGYERLLSKLQNMGGEISKVEVG